MDRKKARLLATELVMRMTLEERASQLLNDAPAIERLGLPSYNWWNEALHGVAREGCATVFPQAIGLASAFDKTLMREIGEIIALEGRAKHNAAVRHGDRDIYKGLTFWAPNINIFRDPRWSRGQETYGEDPYLTASLAVPFVKGIQGEGEYLKAAACAKHFAAHSGPEKLRHEFNAKVSKKDLFETYLPAFEALVKEAKVEAVMGGYSRTNGEPMCAHKFLMKKVLRETWGFEGHFVSDCAAIKDFHKFHKVTSCPVESAAMALNAGCDLNCGCMYENLIPAYRAHLVSEERITESCINVMTTRFLLGLFDEDCPYHDIPYSVVEQPSHIEKALEASAKSIVLLKNDGLLPLECKKLNSIAIIGPNANSRAVLLGNYHGTPSRYITVSEGIQDKLKDSNVRVMYSEGCHLVKERVEDFTHPDDRLSEALTIAEECDVTVLCLGLDESVEAEESDKESLKLPVHQRTLLEAVTKVGKPVIVILLSGSAMDLRFAEKNCNAILCGWYPGAQGGKAIADILFGTVSPSAKLPVTFYESDEDLPEYTDYSMKGRTYRYIEKKPLYPFGFGLTYGKLSICEITPDKCSIAKGQELSINATVSNDSGFDTDEVLQVYVKSDSPFSPPNSALKAFERVHLGKGETKSVRLTLTPDAFLNVDEKGNKVFAGTEFSVSIGNGQPDERSAELGVVSKTLILKVEKQK